MLGHLLPALFCCVWGSGKLQADEECPTWFIPRLSNGSVSCVCGNSLGETVICNSNTNLSMLLYTNCMTYDELSNNTVSGFCAFSYHKPNAHHWYVTLPQNVGDLNDFMCGGLNRTGLQCGQCQPGLGPAVFSYTMQCLQCLDSGPGWLLYVFLATFPTTIFFFIVIFFQVRITSAPMNSFIFECQALVCMMNLNPHSYIDSADTQHNMAVTLLTSYGIWNLDFFRYVIPQFCVGSKLTTIQAISLEYIVAFYPLLLLIVLYTCIQLYARDCNILVHLMRPFQQCCKSGWHPEESLIHSFAAFLVLSYSKIFLVSCRLLHPNVLYSRSGSRVGPLVSFYDPSVTYFSAQHLPFATLAIFVIFTFTLLPLLLLLLYPTRAFHCCLGYFRVRGHALRAFVDAFQGYYKDGTTGTRDWRCFSALYLLIRIVTISSHLLPGSGGYTSVIRIVSYIIASLLFALLRPYKDNRINVLDSVVFAVFTFGEVIVINDEQGGKSLPFIPCLLGILPLAYISLYVTYKLLFWVGLLQRCSLFRNQKSCAHTTDSLYAHDNHDDHSSTTDFPDRVLHPGQYDPLLSCENCTVKENCSEDPLLLKTSTLPPCGNSMSDYGSV